MRRCPRPAVLLIAGALVVGGTASAALVASAPGGAPADGVRRTGVATSASAPAVGSGNAVSDPGARLTRLALARPLLQAREDAVRSGRRDLWAATLDPAAPAFRVRQLTVFDRIRRLPLTTWHYELVDVEDAAPALRAA